jgi:hypothetical protein
MTIFYIVTKDMDDYSEPRFMGLFSSIEKADEYITKFIKKQDYVKRDEMVIKQVELDRGEFW